MPSYQHPFRNQTALRGRLVLVALVVMILGLLAPQALAQTPALPASAPTESGLAGIWQGALDVGPSELRLALKIKQAGNGRFTATLDSIDQGANDIPVSSVTRDGDEVAVSLIQIGARYDGTINAEETKIQGFWVQGGQKFALVLERVEKAATLNRPQEPKEPYPYIAEEVTFRSDPDGVTLAGTLTRPCSAGPHPVVVLLSGSGPQDRNETVMGHRPFLVLADHLTRQGIAVLRFDDRGIAQSKGDFATATDEDFAEDALAAVAYLQTRNEIDPEHIGLIGHSEGGVIAPMAAIKSDDVSFLVLMAGIGVPTRDLLLRQTADIMRLAGADEKAIAEQTRTSEQVYDLLIQNGATPETLQKIRALGREAMNRYTPEQRKATGISEEMIERQIQAATSPWFLHLLAYDPRPTLQQVRVPVLAINGEKDVQVAADENLKGIEAALRAGGNTDVTIQKFPGLNHLFQPATTGGIDEYARIEQTLHPDVLERIATWIKQQTGK